MKTNIPYPFQSKNFQYHTFLIYGKEMEPALYHGDVIFTENKSKQNLNGKLIVFRIDNCLIKIRRFFLRNNGKVELRSDNPHVASIFVNPQKEHLEILGVINATLRKV